MDTYNDMTDKDFDEILEELVGEMSAAEILSCGDVNTILREELNNEVLERWRTRNPYESQIPDLSKWGLSAKSDVDTLVVTCGDEKLQKIAEEESFGEGCEAAVDDAITWVRGWCEMKSAGADYKESEVRMIAILRRIKAAGWENVSFEPETKE